MMRWVYAILITVLMFGGSAALVAGLAWFLFIKPLAKM